MVKAGDCLLQMMACCDQRHMDIGRILLSPGCFLLNRDSPFALDNNSGGGFGESAGLAAVVAAAAVVAQAVMMTTSHCQAVTLLVHTFIYVREHVCSYGACRCCSG
jgi:hypothetical protein